MIELKATTAQEIVRNEKDCDYMDELFGGVKMHPTQVYIKSEADKVIADKDKEIVKLKAQKAQAEDDCAYWKMSEGNAAKAMHETEEYAMQLYNELRHSNYKRCLAMAGKCRLRARWFGDNAFYKKEQWALKWHRRWLKIAEQFKDKETK